MRVPDLAVFLPDERLLRLARVWCVVVAALLLLYWHGQLRVGWTDGVDRPFGEDFLNFWAAAHLAATRSVAGIYDIAAFHGFQVATVGHAIDLYHYSYPPVLALLTMPLGLLPYPIAWCAWQGLGWLAFALALRRIAPRHWALFALAWPAVFVNAMGGQIGCWIAAVAGWGLLLLPRRPIVAGLILSLLVVKPQLGWLVPLALLAGREWRATLAFVAGGLLLLLVTTLWFGPASWLAYATQATLLKRVILEDGYGTWYRMISVFVLLRHIGGSLTLAYAGQAAASLFVAAGVVAVWARRLPAGAGTPLLLTAMLAGSLYVSDYDCVLLALPAAWLWPTATPGGRLAIAMAAVTPVVAAGLAHVTHVALGTLMLWPLLIWTMRPSNIQAALSMPRSPSLR